MSSTSPTESSPYSRIDIRQPSIRLLDLNVRYSAQAQLSGTLRLISLDSKPRYQALSYTWGPDSQEPTCHINISGTLVPITKNCEDALHSLILNFDVCTIWIDAICIDQRNDAEKAHQIPLMRDIYGNAQRVFIWLGTQTEESDYAMDWALDATRNVSVFAGVKLRSFPAIMKPKEVIRILNLLPEMFAKWRLRQQVEWKEYRHDALQDIIHRDWFKRMWTIQELVMANEPLVVCGNKSVRWNDLHWAIVSVRNLPENKRDSTFQDVLNSVLTAESFWLTLYQKKELTLSNVRTWVGEDTSYGPMWNRFLDWLYSRKWVLEHIQWGIFVALICHRFKEGEQPIKSLWSVWVLGTLFTRGVSMFLMPQVPPLAAGELAFWERDLRQSLPGIMNMLRTRQSTYPVDKAFALYGVFSELGIALLTPDAESYQKTEEQVYTELTWTLIDWQQSLDILVEASLHRRNNMASWVPDWNQRLHRIYRHHPTASGKSRPQYQLLKPENLEGQTSWQLPKIITSGIIIDRIIFVMPKLYAESSSPSIGSEENVTPIIFHNTRSIMNFVCMAIQAKIYPLLGDFSRRWILFTLLYNGSIHYWNSLSTRQEYERWLGILQWHFPDGNHTDELPSAISAASVRSCISDLRDSDDIWRYHLELIKAIAEKRTFFLTEHGNLGMGVIGTQANDEVVLIKGLSVPMTLRRNGRGEFQVVGAVYVKGIKEIMGGEAWPQNGQGLREIVLI